MAMTASARVKPVCRRRGLCDKGVITLTKLQVGCKQADCHIEFCLVLSHRLLDSASEQDTVSRNGTQLPNAERLRCADLHNFRLAKLGGSRGVDGDEDFA
jgi:hypothetical protein